MVSSVTQPLTDEQFQRTVEELYGDRPTLTPQAPARLSTARQRWPQAVAQVEEQLRAKLRVEVLPERMRKALEFVRANAVTLHADGTASVQSGKQTYTLSPECPCADAKHRAELCKHALAVELHRRALALFHGTAAESAPTAAPAPTPAAPSATLPVAAAAPLPAAAPSAPASHAWDVHEAPASACFKFRVGNMELMYTLRGIDDDELQRRITATLPTLQEVIEACEERAAQRAAAREAQAAQAPAPQAPPAPQPTSAPADLQTLIQQALQQALNGQAHGTPPPAPPSTGTAAATGGAPFCHVHQAPLELRTNDRGSWWSHWVASEKRYCKGDA
jgi:hypothetical protein